MCGSNTPAYAVAAHAVWQAGGVVVTMNPLFTQRELPAGERGEIQVRGSQVMRGYLNQPSATAATLDADGWLRTGDVGYVDADGSLYVVDRVKEIIKYNAYQVAPAALEAVMLGHHAVVDVAVIPSPDPASGEVPKAFVVLDPPGSASVEELPAFVAERVAPYKKVRRLEFVESSPKAPTGKILRRLLVERERALFATNQAASSPINPAARA